jgi:hypothetical protein
MEEERVQFKPKKEEHWGLGWGLKDKNLDYY